MDPYHFALDTFYGPLDLLLYLVKRNEVDVRDIPIARLAEQFLGYLEVIQTLDVDAAGDFLVMAATLMEIKSKLLLPHPPQPVEEEADPRHELVRQLIEYRKFKDAAQLLETRAEEQQLRLSRQAVELPAPPGGPPPLRNVELWDLVSAFGRLMRDTEALHPKQVVVDETPQHVYETLIHERLSRAGRLCFRNLFVPPYQRPRLIGLFLALLELIRHGRVWLDQPEPFGDIWLSLPTAAAA